MSCFQRIFHVPTKRQIFPSARRLLLGRSHGNHREHGDIPMQAPTIRASAQPERRDPHSASAEANAPRRLSPALGPRLPPPAYGAGTVQKAHICCPGHKRLTLPTAKACGASPTSRAGLDCGGLSVFVEVGPGETASQSRRPGMHARALHRRLCQQAQETGWKSWDEAQVWSSVACPGTRHQRRETDGLLPGQRSLLWGGILQCEALVPLTREKIKQEALIFLFDD